MDEWQSPRCSGRGSQAAISASSAIISDADIELLGQGPQTHLRATAFWKQPAFFLDVVVDVFREQDHLGLGSVEFLARRPLGPPLSTYDIRPVHRGQHRRDRARLQPFAREILPATAWMSTLALILVSRPGTLRGAHAAMTRVSGDGSATFMTCPDVEPRDALCNKPETQVTNPVDSSTAQALLAALEAAANKAPGDRQLVTLINVVSRYIGETEKRLAVLEAKS